ncbi:hypothetical protein [Janibacter sp. Soil728]|uniref:hypothetical protein n=1 Tax=Janibacter sp. Soil728 TaxID=1736393 RepID=UPI0012E8CA70|nr:hypothetical protein [Janibacter sp. Soil728]
MNEHPVAPSPTRQFAPLAVILGIPLLFAAIFFYTTPIMIPSGGAQGIFKCGSPSSPNVEAKNVCLEPESVGKNKAVYSGLSGVALIGLGAVWMLRGQRDEDDEWEGDARRSRRDDDIDLRSDDRGRDTARGTDRDAGRGSLRGGPRSGEDSEWQRSRPADDSEAHTDEGDDTDETRVSRRSSGKRRSVLRDDDFADPPARRRSDDDWESDGWR